MPGPIVAPTVAVLDGRTADALTILDLDGDLQVISDYRVEQTARLKRAEALRSSVDTSEHHHSDGAARLVALEHSANWIGALERGKIRWPREHSRAAW